MIQCKHCQFDPFDGLEEFKDHLNAAHGVLKTTDEEAIAVHSESPEQLKLELTIPAVLTVNEDIKKDDEEDPAKPFDPESI